MGQSARNLGVLRRSYVEINVGRLDDVFESGAEVTPEVLREKRVLRQRRGDLRVLGNGELTKALKVHAHHFSAAAKAKIEAAGGTAEAI
jgi:large subunit ribosomal protein L15